jgi:hypothetical protein
VEETKRVFGSNVDRYAAAALASSPEVIAYKQAKAAFDAALADGKVGVLAELRAKMDAEADRCGDAYREAMAEAREHYR